MNYVTLALSAGGLLAAFVMSILWARARIDSEEYSGRLRLAQNTIKRVQGELATALLDAVQTRKRADQANAQRVAEIKRLEAIIAQHPELSGDLLRDMGRRVLPVRDGSRTP